MTAGDLATILAKLPPRAVVTVSTDAWKGRTEDGRVDVSWSPPVPSYGPKHGRVRVVGLG